MKENQFVQNIEDIKFDGAFKISDQKALDIMYDLILEEGLFLGPTSGINIAGAIKLANELGPNKTIVTVLCDYGNKYTSKVFNKDFLKRKNILFPDWIK